MNILPKLAIALVLFIASTLSFAWVQGNNVTITQIVFWNGGETKPMYFKRSDGVMCYVPANEPTMKSLVLTLYTTKRKMQIHCYDTTEINQGMSGHKLHRIIAYDN